MGIEMAMMETKDEQLIAGFIRRIPPVVWVNWMYLIDDPASKSALRLTLFDDTDRLRDLSSAVVRDDVIACVLQHEPLARLVLGEADQFLDAVADRMVKDIEQSEELD